MPIYFMSLFYLLRKVGLRLEKIQRDFCGVEELLYKGHILLGGTWFVWKERKVVQV